MCVWTFKFFSCDVCHMSTYDKAFLPLSRHPEERHETETLMIARLIACGSEGAARLPSWHACERLCKQCASCKSLVRLSIKFVLPPGLAIIRDRANLTLEHFEY
jgi:hypothetical protein